MKKIRILILLITMIICGSSFGQPTQRYNLTSNDPFTIPILYTNWNTDLINEIIEIYDTTTIDVIQFKSQTIYATDYWTVTTVDISGDIIDSTYIPNDNTVNCMMAVLSAESLYVTGLMCLLNNNTTVDMVYVTLHVNAGPYLSFRLQYMDRDISTSAQELIQESSINVYPNPTNDHITIDFGSNYTTMDGYTLKITNSLSQIVYATPINTQQTTVSLSTWTGNGLYFVHLIDAQGNTIDIRKIVLQ